MSSLPITVQLTLCAKGNVEGGERGNKEKVGDKRWGKKGARKLQLGLFDILMQLSCETFTTSLLC